QHERGRFWNRRVYERASPQSSEAPAATFLPRPPADTRVLLGYVRGRRHLEWIHKTNLYNLRATGTRGRVGLLSSELNADLVVLYGRGLEGAEIWRVSGAPEHRTREDMDRPDYPSPTGKAYYCLPIRRVDSGAWENMLNTGAVMDLRARIAPEAVHGYPITTTWLRFVEAIGALDT